MVNYIISLVLKLVLAVFIYAFFLGTTYYDLKRTYTLNQWHKTTGEVKRVFLSRDSSQNYVSKKLMNTFISYTYTVNETLFADVEMVTRQKVYQTKTSDEEILALEKKVFGKSVTVLYDPSKPSDSSIVPPKNGEGTLLWASIGIVLEFFVLRSILRQVLPSLRK